jgi:hypothetical protein
MTDFERPYPTFPSGYDAWKTTDNRDYGDDPEDDPYDTPDCDPYDNDEDRQEYGE